MKAAKGREPTPPSVRAGAPVEPHLADRWTLELWVRGMVWPPFHAEARHGPVCRTAEQVVAWVLANVPRPQDRSAAGVGPTLPPDSVAVGD